MAARAASCVALLAALALTVSTSGCDTSFSTFAETEKEFSVFGYLDASADTQWVRIEPLQDAVGVGTNPFEARVTTRNLQTGEAAVWQPSVIDLGAGITVQNYYTTTNVAPSAAYRFSVEAPGGAASAARVMVPEDYPTPTYENPPDFGRAGDPIPTTIIVRGIERLGAVKASYTYLRCAYPPSGPPICVDGGARFSHLDDVTREPDGTYRIRIPWASDLARAIRPPFGLVRFNSFHVTVASVSEDWPDYPFAVLVPDTTDRPLPAPGEYSNIENGVGFLGGAVTKTINIPILGEQ